MHAFRIQNLRVVITALTLSFFGLPGIPNVRGAEAGADRPNFIYIMLDDAGYGDFSCYGQKRFSTPHIDKLAAEGLKFTRHYAGSTVCAPTRCSLMSGMHTGHAYIRGNREVRPEGQWPIPADLVTIPKLLHGAGYATGMFGKWGLGAPGSEGDPVRQGFDVFFGYNCQREAHTYYPTHLWRNDTRIPLDGKTYSHDLILEECIAFIREHHDQPFFAYVPVTIPHAAMHVPEADAAPFRAAFPQFAEAVGRYKGPEVRNPAAAFAGMMTRLDRGIGRIMGTLSELGLDRRTLVMVTSDNGPHKEGGHMPDFFDSNGPFRGHKRDLFEGGIRVPMIARWPGTIAPGATTRHLSAHWDVLPTLCDLAGVEVPEHVDGLSFAPTLRGNREGQEKHDYLYWEFHEQGKKQAVRKGRWKAIRLGLAKNPDAPIQLYDLNADPGEETDVASNHPRVVRRLRPLFESARTESEIFTLFPGRTD